MKDELIAYLGVSEFKKISFYKFGDVEEVMELFGLLFQHQYHKHFLILHLYILLASFNPLRLETLGTAYHLEVYRLTFVHICEMSMSHHS